VCTHVIVIAGVRARMPLENTAAALPTVNSAARPLTSSHVFHGCFVQKAKADMKAVQTRSKKHKKKVAHRVVSASLRMALKPACGTPSERACAVTVSEAPSPHPPGLQHLWGPMP
jgi:hypothetical protein